MQGVLALALVGLLLLACDRDRAEARPGGGSATLTTLADGTRQLAIQVSKKGYRPATAAARAGERLTLTFTRTEDFECGRYVKVQGLDGQTELPVGTPVAIAVTMPADGELVFTCGMDMLRGVVAVAK